VGHGQNRELAPKRENRRKIAARKITIFCKDYFLAKLVDMVTFDLINEHVFWLKILTAENFNLHTYIHKSYLYSAYKFKRVTMRYPTSV